MPGALFAKLFLPCALAAATLVQVTSAVDEQTFSTTDYPGHCWELTIPGGSSAAFYDAHMPLYNYNWKLGTCDKKTWDFFNSETKDFMGYSGVTLLKLGKTGAQAPGFTQRPVVSESVISTAQAESPNGEDGRNSSEESPWTLVLAVGGCAVGAGMLIAGAAVAMHRRRQASLWSSTIRYPAPTLEEGVDAWICQLKDQDLNAELLQDERRAGQASKHNSRRDYRYSSIEEDLYAFLDDEKTCLPAV